MLDCFATAISDSTLVAMATHLAGTLRYVNVGMCHYVTARGLDYLVRNCKEFFDLDGTCVRCARRVSPAPLQCMLYRRAFLLDYIVSPPVINEPQRGHWRARTRNSGRGREEEGGGGGGNKKN